MAFFPARDELVENPPDDGDRLEERQNSRPHGSGFERLVFFAVIEQVADAVDRIFEDGRPREDPNSVFLGDERDGVECGDKTSDFADQREDFDGVHIPRHGVNWCLI